MLERYPNQFIYLNVYIRVQIQDSSNSRLMSLKYFYKIQDSPILIGEVPIIGERRNDTFNSTTRYMSIPKEECWVQQQCEVRLCLSGTRTNLYN